MPGGFLNGTASTTPSLDSYYPASEWIDDTLLYPPRWNYQRRSLRSSYDKNAWMSGWSWSFGGNICGDNTTPNQIDCGIFTGGWTLAYEAPSAPGPGNQSIKFLKGTCVDSAGNPVANAIVQGFRTVDDYYVGEVTANNDGTYVLGTNNPASTQHYLVAYKAGTPDIAGTTVNTLTPTNIDGS